MASNEQKMSRLQLTAMIVGGMVGAGIRMLRLPEASESPAPMPADAAPTRRD